MGKKGVLLGHPKQRHQERGDLARMESVLYTLAMKFLTTEELRKVKEMMHMTILGEMILQDGIDIGMKRGVKKGVKKGVKQGVKRGVKQGIKKGAHTERANSVLDLLEDAGSIPRELIDAVRSEQDMDRLREWRRLAARVKSVEEFQQKYLEL